MTTYIYEEYETNWWRRFTEDEYNAENEIRQRKGLTWFRVFWSDYDLGEVIRIRCSSIIDLMRCRHCGHIWPYGGKAEKETSCPQCKGFVSLINDRIWPKS